MVYIPMGKETVKDSKKKPRQKKSTKQSTTALVKSEVKRAISAAIEDKEFRTYEANRIVYSSADNAALNSSIIPLTPYTGFLAIVQGTGQGQRIGNKIKLKTLRLKGTLVPNAFNSITNTTVRPTNIIFWFFYQKDTPTVTPAVGSTFLQLGNSSVGLQNNLTDIWAPINSDLYTLKKKVVYKLGFSAQNPITAEGGDPANQYWNNNDFKLNHHINMDLMPMVVKNIVYNDNTSIPTTRGLFLMIQSVYAGGNAVASGQRLATFSYSLESSYEDA